MSSTDEQQHEFLSTVPFDVYELSLFGLVAASGSFTKAAQQAGLTQSAITRQIAGMEDQLGLRLFERTTRRVSLTPAGTFLRERSEGILRDVELTLQHLREDFADAPKTINIGVSRSIGLAYLPGFFAAFRRKFPAVRTHVVQQPSSEILSAVESNLLQIGVLCPPRHLPSGLKVTHRFKDEFTLIAPADVSLPSETANARKLLQMLDRESWLLLSDQSNTGKLLRQWLRKSGAEIKPAMEADTFDLIVNLVTLGLGCSIVPHRTLPLYSRTRGIQRVSLHPKLSRELVVVIRKDRKPPEHITQFVECVLF